MHVNCFTEADKDYDPLNQVYTVTQQNSRMYEYITIKDNPYHDGNRKFLFRVHDQGQYGVDVWVEICIWDDEWGMLTSIIC